MPTNTSSLNYDAVNFANIQKLINYLERLPVEHVTGPNYSQRTYASDHLILLEETTRGLTRPCNTNCCVAGHAAYAKIGNIHDYVREIGVDWTTYGCENLIDLYKCVNLYQFAFGGSWPSDMQQAILRLKLILARKVPDWFTTCHTFSETDLLNIPATTSP